MATVIPIRQLTPAQKTAANKAAAAKAAAQKAAAAKVAAQKAAAAKVAAQKAAAAKVAAQKAAAAKVAASKVLSTTKKAVAVTSAPATSKIDDAKKKFVEWIKIKDPVLYEMAIKRMARKQNISGFLDVFNSVVSVIKDVAPKVVDIKNQQKILEAQIKAAQSGQPPLNIPYTPVVSNPNTPQAQAIVNAGASYGLPAQQSVGFNRNWLLLGIPALIALFVLLRRKRR